MNDRVAALKAFLAKLIDEPYTAASVKRLIAREEALEAKDRQDDSSAKTE